MIKYDKQWYRRWWGISIIIILTILLSIFFSFVFLFFNARNESKNGGFSAWSYSRLTANPETLTLAEKESGYWLGANDPKIVIVEFGDFACPYCQKTFSKLREISRKYKNDVKIIYRDFPVITEYSQDLALAARCAGEQGLFWPMHDRLYLRQGQITTQEEMKNAALQVGANEKKFQSCMEKKKYLVDIEQDIQDGKKLGVKATPSWIINGRFIAGDIPYGYLIKLIEEISK